MKKKYIFIGICLIVFIINTILVITNKTKIFDDTIYSLIFGLRNNFFDIFNTLITNFANPIPVAIIILVLYILFKFKWKVLLLLNASLTIGINQLLKHIIRRPRPNHLRLVKEGGFSYPSGHAMISICLYGIILYYCLTYIKNKKIKITISSLLVLLILLIGLSRIYLGVHYPSDIIGGYIISTIILITNISIINNFFRGIKINDKDGTK